MKRYRINNMNIYEADPVKEMRFIKRLAKLDYIVTYDKQIIEQEEKILLIPNRLTLLETYDIIKKIYPISYVGKNLKEIGLI
ncbi:MAG TPA: hypothetical protein K8V90_04280 [Romboutsia timonensis]|uniref:Uncharacterized protein n=1 Tax=Romboutsia timonensis TaxID=1776391 RepID=A0A921N0W8_9FIRM|nr:hypothetical protein [Romboutsia timonensis]